jgi:ABC-type glycerol-3-phosphate transport system permease component
VFVLYQQFRSVPRSLVEAAQADGASHVRILIQIISPMSRPVLVAVTLVALLGRWNDYLWPLVVTNSERMRTLTIGIAYLRKQAEEGATPWNLLMAAAVFVVIPIVMLYTVAQRQFVEGITRGALKG